MKPVPPEPAPPARDAGHATPFARQMAHRAQNRWLNGPGGHAEALVAVEATVVEVIEACSVAVADMRDIVDTAQWRRCVNTAVARVRALAGTPATAAAPPTVAPLVNLLREAAFWVGRRADDEHVAEVQALSLALDAAADGVLTVAPALDTEQLVRDLESAIHMIDDELIHGPDDPPHPRAKEFLAYRCRLRGHIDAAARDRASRSPGPGLRPQVAAFARLMEAKLRANDHKGGWWHDGTEALMKRLRQETDELGDITEMSGAWCSAPPSAVLDASARLKVGHEAADVANFATMIADVCGALRGEGPSPAREGTGPTSESPPLSGLDAATVEACAKLCDAAEAMGEVIDASYLAECIRALATPPGQAK